MAQQPITGLRGKAQPCDLRLPPSAGIYDRMLTNKRVSGRFDKLVDSTQLPSDTRL